MKKKFYIKKQLQGIKTNNQNSAKSYLKPNQYNPIKSENKIFDSPLTKKEKEFLKTFDLCKEE